MTLRFKLLLLATLGVVALVLCLHLVSRTVLLGQFEHLEETEALQDLSRTKKILETEIQGLRQKVADYAAWDDTYAFVQKPTDAYIRSNFEDATFDILHLNFALIYDASGKLVFSKGYDFDRKKSVALPPEFFKDLEANHTTLTHLKGVDDSASGLVLLPGRSAMVASVPILTSQRKGPVAGTIVFGRDLDAIAIKRISSVACRPVSIRRLNDPQLPAGFRRVESEVTREGHAFSPQSETLVSAYAMQKDVFGKDGFMIRVDLDREIYQHGQQALNKLILLLAGLGVLFGVLGAVLVERNVLSRLSRLSDELSQIGSSGNLDSRVSKGPDDELAHVASAINRMLSDLGNAEIRYRAIIEDQTELITRYRPDGTITYANSAYARFWQRPTDALIGKRIQDLIPTEDEKERFRAHLARIPSIRPDDSSLTQEIPVRDKDGMVRWLAWTEHVIFDDRGQAIEVQASGRDVTKRKNAEEALQESERCYRSIVEDQTEMICRYRIDGTLTFVNEAYCRSWNRTATELLGKNLIDVVPDEADRKKFREYLDSLPKLTPENSTHINEIITTHPDGRKRWLHWTDRAIFDEQGRLVEIQAVGRDVTEQKEAERALTSNELKYRTLINNIPNVTWRGDAAGRALFISPNVESVFGYTDQEIISSGGALWFGRVHPDDLERVKEAYGRLHQGTGIFDVEYRIQRKDGAWIWIHDRSIATGEVDGLRYADGIFSDITERKRAEERIRLSEEKYRAVLEDQTELICRFKPDGIVVFANSAYCRFFGMRTEEVLDCKYVPLIFPEDVKHVQDKVASLTRDNPTVIIENRVVAAKGEIRWVQWTNRAFFDSAGCPVEYQAVGRDITDSKHSGDERNRLALILEATSDMVGIATPDGREVYLNHAGRRMLGFGETENLEGRQIRESHPESIVSFMLKEAIPAAIRNGLWQGESALLSRDGREIPVSQVILSHKNSMGEVEFVSTIARDISEIKKTQEELTRLSSAIENAAEAVVITDLDANIQYVNPAFEEVSGYSKSEVIGKNPRILKSGKLGAEFYKKMWEALLRGENWTGDFINKRKDGSLFHEEGSISPIRTPAGKILGYVAVKRDVTRQIQMEAELRQAQKMEAIGQLAGGIAHDFNNILASIMGYAKLAADDAPAGSETRDDLEQILKAGRRGKELVEQMLAFSRQSGVKGARTSHQLGEIVKESMKLMRPSLPSSVVIDIKIPEKLPFVLIDPIEIHQVIINLCLNASHAMSSGGKLLVELQSRRITSEDALKMKDIVTGKSEMVPGQYVILTVEDSGTGIPKEILPRIFEPFFTTRKKGQGTGMGLAVVYGIVKSHHGIIHVYTEIDKGTTFRIYLPTAQTAEHYYPEQKPKEVKGGTESILVVDDEEPLAKMIGKTLARLGYRVTVKSNSVEALELVRKTPDAFDLVISDQTMPGLTGDKLAQEIRKIRPNTPIILCSGFSEILTPEREQEVKVDKLIRKPFVAGELELAIRKILDKQAKK